MAKLTQSSFPTRFYLACLTVPFPDLFCSYIDQTIFLTHGLLMPLSLFPSSYSKHRYKVGGGIDIILEHEYLSIKMQSIC